MNLNELTLTEMINGLSAGEFSASEIATAVIDHIEATSDLGAIIGFDENFYLYKGRIFLWHLGLVSRF